MLYTEDTYEIPDQPYFGWMRGRYSMQELRELDDCADALGIELCPCIQTLGHLNRALHWPAMAHLKDNEEVLLADNEETYAFLKQAIQAAAAPYRSRRIHIGMDEAHGIGWAPICAASAMKIRMRSFTGIWNGSCASRGNWGWML